MQGAILVAFVQSSPHWMSPRCCMMPLFFDFTPNTLVLYAVRVLVRAWYRKLSRRLDPPPFAPAKSPFVKQSINRTPPEILCESHSFKHTSWTNYFTFPRQNYQLGQQTRGKNIHLCHLTIHLWAWGPPSSPCITNTLLDNYHLLIIIKTEQKPKILSK